jgi:hypothetical protein
MALVKWVGGTVVAIALLSAGAAVHREASLGARAARAPTVGLQLELYGGFAYLHRGSDAVVNVAYLRDNSGPGSECASHPVDQLGVDLMVVSGTIVQPVPAPPNRMFEVSGTVMTFPGLASSTEPLSVTRSPRQEKPANPKNPAHWYDLQWVAGISSGAPPASLKSNWRGSVDGYVELRHGRLRAAHPSDVVARDTIFEFRPRTQPAGSGFRQAMTDRTIFIAKVPADRVAIDLKVHNSSPPTPASPVSRIEVVPTAPGRPVRLKLIGRHSHATPPALKHGEPVNHFCAFYALLERTPPIPEAAQLIPHVYQINAGNHDNVGQPSPGPYCPGGWP